MEADKNSSGTLFLSRPIAEDITHEVYTFELPDKAEDVFIMYNALADKPVFRAGASFQNDVLMLVNEETNEKQRTGKKQPLRRWEGMWNGRGIPSARLSCFLLWKARLMSPGAACMMPATSA